MGLLIQNWRLLTASWITIKSNKLQSINLDLSDTCTWSMDNASFPTIPHNSTLYSHNMHSLGCSRQLYTSSGYAPWWIWIDVPWRSLSPPTLHQLLPKILCDVSPLLCMLYIMLYLTKYTSKLYSIPVYIVQSINTLWLSYYWVRYWSRN